MSSPETTTSRIPITPETPTEVMPRELTVTREHRPNNRKGRSWEEQIVDQVKDILGGPDVGTPNLEGLSWTEQYKDKEKQIIGGSSFVVVADTIKEVPYLNPRRSQDQLPASERGASLSPNPKRWLPMHAGHKALVPSRSHNPKRDSYRQASTLTVIEYDMHGNIREEKTFDRHELLERLEGYNEGRVTGFTYLNPNAKTTKEGADKQDTKHLFAVPLHLSPDMGGTPHQRLVQAMENLGVEETQAYITWEDDEHWIMAHPGEVTKAPTIYGGLPRLAVRVDFYSKQTGQLVNQKMFSDNTEPGGIKKLKKAPGGNATPFENFFNGAFENMRNLRLELELTEEEMERRRFEAQVSARRHETYAWLGRMTLDKGDLATDPLPEISKEEALDLLTYIPKGVSDAKAASIRKNTEYNARYLIRPLQDISRELGKEGIEKLANDMLERYKAIVSLLDIPTAAEEAASTAWIVEALAEERRKADDPKYAETIPSDRTPADPIGNTEFARQKRLEIVNLRIGKNFFDYTHPKPPREQTIVDPEAKRKLVKLSSREPIGALMIKIERSARAHIDELMKLVVAKEQAELPHDQELEAVGRLLARTVGR